MARRRRRGKGEGSVFFDESRGTGGLWVGRVLIGRKADGRPRYKEHTARTQQELIARMQATAASAAAGRPVSDKPATLSQWLDRWLAETAKPNVAPATYRSYERCVRLHIKPNLGGYEITELRPAHVTTFFSELQEAGMEAGNQRKVREVLSTALTRAVEHEWISANPAAFAKRSKAKSPRIVVFTDAEVKAILDAAATLRLGAMIALALGTGARQGELLALGWEHVDLAAGQVHILQSLDYDKARGGFYFKAPKSDRGVRLVDLPAFAVDALTRHRASMEGEGNIEAPVFCTKTGNPIGKSNFVRQIWTPLLAAAGVTYRKFHTARHTHASRLLIEGVSVPEVARRLGDAQETILRTYSHYIPGNGAEVARKVDRFYT